VEEKKHLLKLEFEKRQEKTSTMTKKIEDKHSEYNKLKIDSTKINTEIAAMESKVHQYSNDLYRMFKSLQSHSNEVDK